MEWTQEAKDLFQNTFSPIVPEATPDMIEDEVRKNYGDKVLASDIERFFETLVMHDGNNYYR